MDKDIGASSQSALTPLCRLRERGRGCMRSKRTTTTPHIQTEGFRSPAGCT